MTVAPRFVAVGMAALLFAPVAAVAQERIVPRAKLRQDLRVAAAERQRNLESLELFFSSEIAGSALAANRLDALKVRQAISHLNDVELARLAAQVHMVEAQFAAGRLTTQQVNYIIFGAIAVAIIAIVAAAT